MILVKITNITLSKTGPSASKPNRYFILPILPYLWLAESLLKTTFACLESQVYRPSLIL